MQVAFDNTKLVRVKSSRSRSNIKVTFLKKNSSFRDISVSQAHVAFLILFAGTPRCIRTDAGTENVTIINMQKALGWYHDDEQSGERSVIVGSSHSNQAMLLLPE